MGAETIGFGGSDCFVDASVVVSSDFVSNSSVSDSPTFSASLVSLVSSISFVADGDVSSTEAPLLVSPPGGAKGADTFSLAGDSGREEGVRFAHSVVHLHLEEHASPRRMQPQALPHSPLQLHLGFVIDRRLVLCPEAVPAKSSGVLWLEEDSWRFRPEIGGEANSDSAESVAVPTVLVVVAPGKKTDVPEVRVPCDAMETDFPGCTLDFLCDDLLDLGRTRMVSWYSSSSASMSTSENSVASESKSLSSSLLSDSVSDEEKSE